MRFLVPQGLMWTKNCESLCKDLHLWFLPFFAIHIKDYSMFVSLSEVHLYLSLHIGGSPAETSNVENFNCQFNYRGLLLKHKSSFYQMLRTSIVNSITYRGLVLKHKSCYAWTQQMLRTSIVNSITYRGLVLKHKSFYDWICWMPRNSIVNSITLAQHFEPWILYTKVKVNIH